MAVRKFYLKVWDVETYLIRELIATVNEKHKPMLSITEGYVDALN